MPDDLPSGTRGEVAAAFRRALETAPGGVGDGREAVRLAAMATRLVALTLPDDRTIASVADHTERRWLAGNESQRPAYPTLVDQARDRLLSAMDRPGNPLGIATAAASYAETVLPGDPELERGRKQVHQVQRRFEEMRRESLSEVGAASQIALSLSASRPGNEDLARAAELVWRVEVAEARRFHQVWNGVAPEAAEREFKGLLTAREDDPRLLREVRGPLNALYEAQRNRDVPAAQEASSRLRQVLGRAAESSASQRSLRQRLRFPRGRKAKSPGTPKHGSSGPRRGPRL